jgi:hypothetical protein
MPRNETKIAETDGWCEVVATLNEKNGGGGGDGDGDGDGSARSPPTPEGTPQRASHGSPSSPRIHTAASPAGRDAADHTSGTGLAFYFTRHVIVFQLARNEGFKCVSMTRRATFARP